MTEKFTRSFDHPQILFTAAVMMLLSWCSSCGPGRPKFDQKVFLEHYAYKIIQPASQQLMAKAGSLQSSIQALIESPSGETLEAAQAVWDETYRAWIEVSMLNFGPGGTEGRRRTLTEEVALWPVDVEGINEKLETGEYKLDDAKRNTRGLLAIEYLLFDALTGGNLEADLNESRATYLELTTDKLVDQLRQFNEAWQGDFAVAFIAAEGTNVKSSTTQMFNETVRSYEVLRDMKLGIPMGLIAGQSGPQPDLAEAPYSQKSLDYLMLHYQTIVALWHGKTKEGEAGPGWKDYLLSVEGGDALVQQIMQKMATVDGIIDQVDQGKSLGQLALEKDAQLALFYQELQQLTRLLKGDSSSLLGLAITFSSGDGD